MNFWQKIEQPIKLLAPMAGYTDSTFRELCRKQGADVVMTELISADAIYFALKKSSPCHPDRSPLFCHPDTPLRHPEPTPSCHPELDSGSIKAKSIPHKFLSSKTYNLMKFDQAERPVVIQLFGKDPEKFIAAAKFIEQDLKADGIDINMGCSVRKVLKSGHGAALLKDEDSAISLVKELSLSTKLPVSVKLRLGYEDPDQILLIGPKLAKAGAKAIIVHGRTAKQGFSGHADWTNIYKLKELIPETIIIGNGDIQAFEEIELRVGNLDGVAIGRSALGQPWIFSGKKPTYANLKKLALRQARLAYELKGDHGIIELRKHLVWYFKGLNNATEIRKELVKVETIHDIELILDKIN